jgi:hypothetical protein
MYLYKIGIIGLNDPVQELAYFHVLSESVSDIEKWMDNKWGKDMGLCLDYVQGVENMDEHLCSVVELYKHYEVADFTSMSELVRIREEIEFRIKHQERVKRRTEKIVDSDMHKRALRLLVDNGIETVDQLSKITSKSILKIRGMGVDTIKEIREYLEWLGIVWE